MRVLIHFLEPAIITTPPGNTQNLEVSQVELRNKVGTFTL
jgi:hypothetical protein